MSVTSASVRTRTMTEKGKAYKLGLLQKKRYQCELEVRKMITYMENLFTEDKLVEMRECMEKLGVQFEQLLTIHGQCQILIDSEERENDDLYVDQLDKTVYAFRKRVRSWLSSNEVDHKDIDGRSRDSKQSNEIKSHKSSSSKSNVKSKSSSSKSRSTRSIELKVKEEKARLADWQEMLEDAKLSQMSPPSFELENNERSTDSVDPRFLSF